MSYEKITVEKFKNLKQRLDNELKRRKYKYAVSSLNVPYTEEPTKGGVIKSEHYQKNKWSC